MCLELPDDRCDRGLPYPIGLMLFGVFLAICAARTTQRSQAIWFRYHWRWIVKVWRAAKGAKPGRSGPPSQPTISRFLSTFDPRYLASLMTQYGRDGFADEWKDYVKKTRETQKAQRNARKARKPNGPRVNRWPYTPAPKRLPQYCLDGKARGGCISKLTGRTEIDLTVYSPETAQVLAHTTLPDKLGEQTAAFALIFSYCNELPAGIFTGDAGITSPDVVKVIRAMGHSYLLALKGNAGKVHDVVADFDWESIEQRDMFFSEGHGRQEIRTVKSLPISAFASNEFDKYHDIARVYSVRAEVYHPKKDLFEIDTRFFIADRGVAAMSSLEVLTYVREHWKQESFHWIKDAILGEDACPTKNPRGSQTLGLVRDAVVKIAKSMGGSVKKFIDHFSASPEQTYTKGL